MKVIYSCYGGAHSSPVAAAIHLGWLPEDRVPDARALMQLPRFDRSGPESYGVAELVGEDAQGHQVYVLARGPSGEAVERAFFSGVGLAGGDPSGFLLVDTLSCVNLFMRAGGYLSRGLGWTAAGRPIVLWGTRRAYPRLVRLVQRTKKRLEALARQEENRLGGKN